MANDDALKIKAERAAEAVYRVLPDELSGPRMIGYVAGYLAHAKEAEALVDRLDNAEDVLRIIYHCTEGKTKRDAHECAARIAEALARYRGGADGKALD